MEARTIYVTTLAPHGPGSLREALESEGPRKIVFDKDHLPPDVPWVITLSDFEELIDTARDSSQVEIKR